MPRALQPPPREDALATLEAVLDARADLVAASHLAPILAHFGDLLSRSSRGQSLKAGSLAALLRVVTALERVLERATRALAAAVGSGGGPAQQCQPSAEAADAADAARALMWRRCEWAPLSMTAALAKMPPLIVLGERAAHAGGGRQQRSAAAAGSSGAGTNAAPVQLGSKAGHEAAAAAGASGEALARTLLGHLLDCWSECGPGQLAQAPDLAAAQCLASTLRCVCGRHGVLRVCLLLACSLVVGDAHILCSGRHNAGAATCCCATGACAASLARQRSVAAARRCCSRALPRTFPCTAQRSNRRRAWRSSWCS